MHLAIVLHTSDHAAKGERAARGERRRASSQVWPRNHPCSSLRRRPRPAPAISTGRRSATTRAGGQTAHPGIERQEDR